MSPPHLPLSFPRRNNRRLRRFAAALALGCLGACSPSPGVALYVALDQQHSEHFVREFERKTGLHVTARFDTEASKTVGLVSAIVEEAARPRCDVFWNNELAHTVRLAQKGLLAPYDSPAAKTIPAAWCDPQKLWHGFAARARILIVNTDLIPDPKDRPRSLWDLIDPRWKGRCAIARPLTGTTLTHFAALRLALGAAEFDRLVLGLFANQVVFLQSNGATMRAVRDGQLAFALTDTDDFHVALRKGHKVACVFPDQQAGGLGTMLIPNSVALVKGGPNPEAARKLIDYILSEEVEAALAAAASAQIPLRAGVEGPPERSILRIHEFRPMAWDIAQTAASLEGFVKQMQERFSQ